VVTPAPPCVRHARRNGAHRRRSGSGVRRVAAHRARSGAGRRCAVAGHGGHPFHRHSVAPTAWERSAGSGWTDPSVPSWPPAAWAFEVPASYRVRRDRIDSHGS
jgi:hypothetical protein